MAKTKKSVKKTALKRKAAVKRKAPVKKKVAAKKKAAVKRIKAPAGAMWSEHFSHLVLESSQTVYRAYCNTQTAYISKEWTDSQTAASDKAAHLIQYPDHDATIMNRQPTS
jgi:hypothetical protein